MILVEDAPRLRDIDASGSSFDQGSSISNSRYVLVMPYSVAPSGMRSSRFNSLVACSSASFGRQRAAKRACIP